MEVHTDDIDIFQNYQRAQLISQNYPHLQSMQLVAFHAQPEDVKNDASFDCL